MPKADDLYSVLGIEPEAPQDIIKRAWKRMMQRAHPDKPGGSREAFDRVQTAMMVLSDPVKRERYDRTGEYDTEAPVDNETASVHQLLMMCVSAVVSGDMPDEALSQVDMIEKFRELLAQPRKQAEDALAKNKRARRRFERLRGRFKGEHAPLIEANIRFNLAQIDEMDANSLKLAARCDKVEEILKGLSFEQEAPARDLWYSLPTARQFTRFDVS